MNTCMNVPISDEVSGCLVEHPSCQYAVKLGFSYLCEHPGYANFNDLDNSVPFKAKMELIKSYDELRNKRRHEYLDHNKEFLKEMGIHFS